MAKLLRGMGLRLDMTKALMAALLEALWRGKPDTGQERESRRLADVSIMLDRSEGCAVAVQLLGK